MKIYLTTTKNAKKKAGGKYPYMGIMQKDGSMAWAKPTKSGNTLRYENEFASDSYTCGVAGNIKWDFDIADWRTQTVWFFVDKNGIQIMKNRDDLKNHLATIEGSNDADSTSVATTAATRVVPEWLEFWDGVPLTIKEPQAIEDFTDVV